MYATVKYNPLLKMEYGTQLNAERSLRTPKGIKGTRQKVIVTHNRSEIDQAKELLVRFPNLGSHQARIYTGFLGFWNPLKCFNNFFYSF